MEGFNINEGKGGFNVGYFSTDSVHATSASWTRQSRFAGPLKPVIKNVFEAPILVKQNHFVINNRSDLLFGGEGAFYSVNIEGKINWQYNDSRHPIDRFFFTSPVILKNGYILFGTSGSWDSKGHKVMAFDNDGHMMWEYRCDHAVSSSCVTDHEGNIYFTTYDSKLFSVDMNGNLRWIFQYESEFSITPEISNDFKIYISSNDEHLMILDRFGNLLKTMKIGTCGPNSYPLFDDLGNLYLKSNMIDDIQLISLSSEGTIKWFFSPEKGDIITSPAMNNAGYLFVGASFFQLVCVDSAGMEVWNTSVEGFMSQPPIVDSNNNIYTVSFKETKAKRYSYLQSFNNEGKENWRIKLEGYLTLPVLSSDGEIVLLLNNTSGLTGSTKVITVTQKK